MAQQDRRSSAVTTKDGQYGLPQTGRVKPRLKMGAWVIRAIFIVVTASTAYYIAEGLGQNVFYWLLGGIFFSLLMVAGEVLLSSQPISSISAIVFGIIIGVLFAMLLQRVIILALGANRSEVFFGRVEALDKKTNMKIEVPAVPNEKFDAALSLVLSVVLSYVGVAVMYQTRNRFNLIIPYVEFRPVEKGAKPILLDTSVIIDGRINEVLETGIFDGPIVISHSVLKELHNIADSSERTRRERGRLGLECLERMRKNPLLDVHIQDAGIQISLPTDEHLIQVSKKLNARLITNDFNLNQLANVESVDVINLNKLANSLKPVALPDEHLNIKLMRPGQQPGQAIGYLDDGTMVVVENASAMLGREVQIVVTNTITKETGRMIFGRLKDAEA